MKDIKNLGVHILAGDAIDKVHGPFFPVSLIYNCGVLSHQLNYVTISSIGSFRCLARL